MAGAGSREKKPAQSGWAQEARWRRWPRPTLKVQEGDWAEGESDFTPKEQQGKRPRVRRAGSRRAQDELVGGGGVPVHQHGRFTHGLQVLGLGPGMEEMRLERQGGARPQEALRGMWKSWDFILKAVGATEGLSAVGW